MSTVLSPTPPIGGEPDLAGRLARPDARRGGPRRANPAAARASHGRGQRAGQAGHPHREQLDDHARPATRDGHRCRVVGALIGVSAARGLGRRGGRVRRASARSRGPA